MASGVPTFPIDGKEPTATRRSWFVLHVKPRTEKKVVTYLKRYRCFAHLPVYVKITKVQRRKVRRELPLFPGYVFTRLSPDERITMLQTNLLVNTIFVPRPRDLIIKFTRSMFIPIQPISFIRSPMNNIISSEAISFIFIVNLPNIFTSCFHCYFNFIS